MPRELISIYQLTRLKEHLGSSIVVTALGLSIVPHIAQISVYRAVMIFLANFLCMMFSFMLNDIEDAEDDLLDKDKAQRNPVSAKRITKRRAYFYTWIVGFASLFLFASLGLPVLFIGAASLMLGTLYSWKKIRLKARPLIDVISHALFLGLLQFLAASLVDSNMPPLTLLVWIGFSIFTLSVLGDMYNELRDYEVDKKSGHLNTTQLFGLKRFERYVKYIRVLPTVSVVLYFIFTFSLFNVLAGVLFAFLVACFYYLHGYRNGRPFYGSVYTTVLQTGFGIILIAQTFVSVSF